MHAAPVTAPPRPEPKTVPLEQPDSWYVTNGSVAVGPVSFELLGRGLSAGRVPPDSFVRHNSWKVWRRLQEIVELSEEKRAEAVTHLAQVSVDAEARASRPDNEPPPPPAAEDVAAPANENAPTSIRPEPVDPAAVFETAADLDSALLIAVCTAVAASAAQIGLFHVVRPDLGATVTAYAHGPNAEAVLGERLAENDASLLAAQGGHTIVGELRLGEAGRYIAGRVARALPGPRGVAMVPVRVNSALLGLIELGRTTRPFRAREIAACEDMVEALVERIDGAGWLS